VLRSRRPESALALLDSASELGPLDAGGAVLMARCASIAHDERAVDLWTIARDGAIRAREHGLACRALVELVRCGAEQPAALASVDAAGGGWATYATALDCYYRGDAAGVLAAARPALELARDVEDDPELEVSSLRLISHAHAQLGELDLAVAVLREVIDVADHVEDPRALTSAVIGLSYTLVEALRADEAVDVAELFERIVDPRDAGPLRAVALAARAMAAMLVGDLARATALMQQSVAIAPIEGSDADVAFRAAVLGECVASARGASPATARTLDAVARVLDDFGYESYIARLRIVRGTGALAAGDIAPLVAGLGAVDHDLEVQDTAFGAVQLARAWRTVPALAARDVPRVLAGVGRPADPTPYAALAWREVDALLAADRDSLEQVAAEWRAAGFGWFAALVTLALARLELADGEVERARTLGLEALHGLTECGAVSDVLLARALLDELDGTIADPAPLLRCSLFADVEPRVIAGLARHARRVEVAAGRLVDELLADDDGLVILGSGLAFVVSRRTPDAPILDARVDGEAHVRDWHGASRAEGREQPGLLAASDLVAWVIPSSQLRRASVGEPRLLGALMRLADGDAARSRELAEDLATADVRQRLARLLLRLERDHGRPSLRGDRLVDVPLTAAQLARMCGTQRQRVSTMLAAWRRDGVLDTWRRRIVIDDLEALRVAAGLAPCPAAAAG
jgi:CRP-like cAMP-binding protein